MSRVTEKDREAAWAILKQRSWEDELPLAEAEATDKPLGEWYYGASAIAELAEAIATARAEGEATGYAKGRREALEEAATLCDALTRDECSTTHAANCIRSLAEKEE